jgi:hypothetical protein
MICFVILIAAGLLAIPRLREIGFFGATRTTPPDIEISRKSGTLGVYINPDLIPSLSPGVDTQYSGRLSTNTRTSGPLLGEDLLSYFSRQPSAPSNLGTNPDTGQPY